MKLDRNKILVADDDMFFRRVIRSCMQEYADIYDVDNGADVLQKYKEIRPHILFLDIHLPEREGHDVLIDILAFDPKAYVIMISSDSVPKNVIQSKSNGARGFVCKPFKQDTIMRYIFDCPGMVFSDTSIKA